MAQTNIKLGYIRDPESHEMYFPYTHYLGVTGLDNHVLELIGGTVPTKLTDLTNDLTTNGTLTINGSARVVLIPYGNILSDTWYAPTTVGSNGNILRSNGSGAPTWDGLENIIGKKSLGYTLVGNGTGSSDGNVSWRALTLTDLSLYAKELTHSINGATSGNVIGTVISNSNSNLTIPEFYAPITSGDQYNLLISNGSGAPIWTSLPLTSDGLLKFTGTGWDIDTTPIPYYDNYQFHFGNNSFSFLEDVVTRLTSTSTGSSNISSDTANPYLRILEQSAGYSTYTDIGTYQFKGSVDANNFGIQVIGKADKTINFGLIGAGDLAAIEALTGTGYLQRTGDNAWSLGTPVSTTLTSVYSDDTTDSTIAPTSASAGLKVTTNGTVTYHKISASALVNDKIDILILNGNFS